MTFHELTYLNSKKNFKISSTTETCILPKTLKSYIAALTVA